MRAATDLGSLRVVGAFCREGWGRRGRRGAVIGGADQLVVRRSYVTGRFVGHRPSTRESGKMPQTTPDKIKGRRETIVVIDYSNARFILEGLDSKNDPSGGKPATT